MFAQMNVDLCIITDVASAVRFAILLERRVCSCSIIYWKWLTDLLCNLLCGSVHVFVGMVSLTCVQFELRCCVCV